MAYQMNYLYPRISKGGYHPRRPEARGTVSWMAVAIKRGRSLLYCLLGLHISNICIRRYILLGSLHLVLRLGADSLRLVF